MCDPVTMAATMAVSQTLQIMGQRKVARGQQRYQKQQSEANATIAGQNAVAQYEALVRREDQENQATAQAIAQTREEALRAAAASRASAGGTAGQSLGLILDSYETQRLRASEAARQNLGFKKTEFEAQRQATHLGHHSTLINTAPKPVAEPNLMIGALKVATSAAEGYYTAGGE